MSSPNLTLSNPAPRASALGRIAWYSPVALWLVLGAWIGAAPRREHRPVSSPVEVAPPPPPVPSVRYDIEVMPGDSAETYLRSHLESVFAECGVSGQRARVRATFGPRGLEDARLLTPRVDAACVSRALTAQRPPSSRFPRTYEVDLVRAEQRRTRPTAPQVVTPAPPAQMAAERPPRRARRPERIW